MQLKNLLYSAILALAAPLTSYGQAGRHELSLSYGTVSGTQLIDGLRTTMQYNGLRPYTNLQISNTGNIFLTYRYGVTRGFDIGFTAGVQHYSFERYYDDNLLTTGLVAPPKEGTYDVTVITYAAEFKPAYYTGEHFQLYGFLGVGVRNYRSTADRYNNYFSGTSVLPEYFINTQWTPFGIRFGKTFSGFAEFGFGYKGLANVGISYILNSHKNALKPKNKPEENTDPKQ